MKSFTEAVKIVLLMMVAWHVSAAEVVVPDGAEVAFKLGATNATGKLQFRGQMGSTLSCH